MLFAQLLGRERMPAFKALFPSIHQLIDHRIHLSSILNHLQRSELNCALDAQSSSRLTNLIFGLTIAHQLSIQIYSGQLPTSAHGTFGHADGIGSLLQCQTSYQSRSNKMRSSSGSFSTYSWNSVQLLSLIGSKVLLPTGSCFTFDELLFSHDLAWLAPIP